MSNLIARIGIIGDTHLCAKSYGAHRDYTKECLEYFTKVSDITEELKLTHLIGTGDFTYGKFDKLEFREKVEHELERQNRATNGNRYEVMGNHDTATNGMTEYEYYVRRGLLKKSTNLSLGMLNITMLDYKRNGKYTPDEMNIINDGDHFNLAIAHQYFKFSDTILPNFGDAIILDNYKPFFGIDYLVCGHVHKIMDFTGQIESDDSKKNCLVQYLGCMMRPAYREGHMDSEGIMDIIEVYDDGKIEVSVKSIELWSLEKSFNLDQKAVENEKKLIKAARVDISDIVKKLDEHERNVGNPEDIIMSMDGISDKYKAKAIDLLKQSI